jgi:hypothetical protein
VTRSPMPPLHAGAAARPAAQPTSDAAGPGTSGAAPSVRAQLLATEHWSLLATRSTTQSEVLSRITTFLMLVSASIVSLALIGQATRFDRRFLTFALVLLSIVVMVGLLTQVRLGNAAVEDRAHVIGMNRLRAAYLELDPGIERYLVTSAHDDDNGIWQTYNHLMGPNPTWQPFASSPAFIMLVNAALTGALAGLVAVALGATGSLVGAVAAAWGLAFLGSTVTLAARRIRRVHRRHVSLFPAPDTAGDERSDNQPVAEELAPARCPARQSTASATTTRGGRQVRSLA